MRRRYTAPLIECSGVGTPADDASPLDAEDAAALVARIGGGGSGAAQAEAALCRRYAPRVRHYGERHLRDPEAVRDLTQIVLLGLLEAARAGRVREPEHLERFILGICRNTAIRLRQKGERLQPSEGAFLEALLVTEEREAIDGRALSRCLERLEPRARTVVTLAFRDERTAEEIGAALGISAGNARVIRHRALAALRDCLEGSR
jgi:RNA polymerase sigma-70 factor (ECF subfamily)